MTLPQLLWIHLDLSNLWPRMKSTRTAHILGNCGISDFACKAPSVWILAELSSFMTFKHKPSFSALWWITRRTFRAFLAVRDIVPLLV
jgi:hypothetical protein